MTEIQEFFEDLYNKFNHRDIEEVLAKLSDDVKWANGMEGGFVNGRDAVREYWTRQFSMINARVEPQKFETNGDKTVVTIHQLVKDLDGNVLEDTTVKHIFQLEKGLVKTFEIGDDHVMDLESQTIKKGQK